MYNKENIKTWFVGALEEIRRGVDFQEKHLDEIERFNFKSKDKFIIDLQFLLKTILDLCVKNDLTGIVVHIVIVLEDNMGPLAGLPSKKKSLFDLIDLYAGHTILLYEHVKEDVLIPKYQFFQSPLPFTLFDTDKGYNVRYKEKSVHESDDDEFMLEDWFGRTIHFYYSKNS